MGGTEKAKTTSDRDRSTARFHARRRADGETVGFLDARLEPSPDPMLRPIAYCYIAELAVRAEHRSRGVGRELMAAAEDWGRQQGAAFASLDYHVSNHRAAGFYGRVMGYRAAHIVALKHLQPR
jgi:ribosomal protein S18 acetylase RimI-like enzyme